MLHNSYYYVTLYDYINRVESVWYGCGAQDTAVNAKGQCHEVYATVKERVTGRIDTICASRTRFTEVYRCHDTPLEIRTLPGSGLRTRYFLLKYQGTQLIGFQRLLESSLPRAAYKTFLVLLSIRHFRICYFSPYHTES